LGPRKRLVFVRCFVAVVAALTMHRRPRPEPARIHLAEVQQRVEALRQEVELARAAPDPAGAYTPKTAGSIADLSTDAAALLRQLPGVENVAVPVTCPQPTHRIMHLRDRHLVPWDEVAIALAHELGRPLLVALTGLGSEAVRAQALECGLDYLLVNPVNVEDLLRLLSLDRSTG
jgi:hypothetical protein